jgi:hypothetical protein
MSTSDTLPAPPPSAASDGYWTELADNYVVAYRHLFEASPSSHAVIFAMCVAEHETRNGRAWAGSHNFGGVQLRGLTPEESAKFKAGQLSAGATLPGNPGGILKVDTTPTPTGPRTYPVWFATFPTEVDGIIYFLKVLFGYRHGCKAVADDDEGSLEQLAGAMYSTGYYEGFVSGARPLDERIPPFNQAEQANVDAYTSALMGAFRTISLELVDWKVGFNLSTLMGVQEGLIAMAKRLDTPEFNPGTPDGIMGPRTEGALKAFQSYSSIPASGVVDDATRAVLEAELA